MTSRPKERKQQRHWLSLPVRISFGLVCAAVIPLVIVLFFISLQTDPALIGQANKAMASDAQTRVQLIDAYFTERVLDAETLTQVTSVQTFVALPVDPTSAAYQNAALHAGYSLVAGVFRNKNYTTWTIFNKAGQVLLTYPTQTKPAIHGKYLVPPEELAQVLAGKSFISPVYYSQQTAKASVDIYSPVRTAPTNPSTPATGPVIGFLRATLNLDYIWNIVQTDKGNNGTGSYAFILDNNGVRIADTDAQFRFTSVASLAPDIQQSISQEARYGTTSAVRVRPDSALANSLKSQGSSETFQAQPTGTDERYQIVRQAATTVPWNYYVLSPESTETAVAYQQQLSTTLVACLAALCVAIIGLFAGRGISRPILRAVEYLRGNSQSLTKLATNQQDAASEQMWVVDSSQVGMQSVQYYTEAIHVASRKLRETTAELIQHKEHADRHQLAQILEHIGKTTTYIEDAVGYQVASNQKLSTALKVATQVTEQLHIGATSATEAATQMEQVVKELRSVVGR